MKAFAFIYLHVWTLSAHIKHRPFPGVQRDSPCEVEFVVSRLRHSTRFAGCGNRVCGMWSLWYRGIALEATHSNKDG